MHHIARFSAAIATLGLLAACGSPGEETAAPTSAGSAPQPAGAKQPSEMPALSTQVLIDLAAGDPKLMAELPALEAGERAAIRQVMDEARAKLAPAKATPTAALNTWQVPQVARLVPQPHPGPLQRVAIRALDLLIAPAGAAEFIGVDSVRAIAVGYVFTNFLGAAADQGHGEPGKEQLRSEFADDSGKKASLVIKTEMDGRVTSELNTEIAVPLFLVEANSKVSITTRGLCPDANGKVEFTIHYNSGGHRGGGTNMAYDRTREARVSVTVNDDAEIADADIDTQYGDRSTANGQQTYAGASTSWTAEGGDISKLRVISHGNVRMSSAATAADQQRLDAAAKHAVTLGQAALSGASSHWQNGACIKIIATSPGVVKRKAESKIPVKVIHRLDGSDVAAKVKVELTGGESVDPALIPHSPGTITHIAPDAKVAKMSIELTARSKRGMATATLKLLVNAGSYSAEGGAGDFHGEGRICSLAEPFTISGSGITVSFTPASEQGGTYTYNGNVAGFHLHGNGRYTVQFDGEVAVGISATGPGAVDDAMGSGDEHYTLAPLQAYQCDDGLM